jgi:predicted amidohydrolase
MKVASAQSDVFFGDPEANALAAAKEIGRLAGEGVELAVFPECFLTGYCVDSAAGAREIAIPRSHQALQAMKVASDHLGIAVAFGFAEAEGDGVYNTAALFVPGETPYFYRKTHLPELGLDKFVTAGDELALFDTRLGKIGILICFDQRFPEPCRVLSLAGADLILIPTNWPDGAQVSADFISIARAAENKVWMVTTNRVGTENGFTFIGRSKIIAPNGTIVAAAGSEAETLVAEIDLAQARQKRNVTIPGKYETEVFAARRPALYEELFGKE